MKCPEFESILADYLDGSLPEAERAAVESHAAECASCGAFMAEVTEGVSLAKSLQPVDPPSELVTRIAFHAPVGRVLGPFDRPTLWTRFSQAWLQPVLQPKFVMGAAMMLLSFTMLERCTGVRIDRVQSADLSPVHVWSDMEMKVGRTKDRMLKYYENLRVVYEVEARLRDMQRRQEQDSHAAALKAQPQSTNPPAANPQPAAKTQKDKP